MATAHYPVNTHLVHQNAFKTLIAPALVANVAQICAIRNLVRDHKLVQIQLEVVTKEIVRHDNE